MLFMFSYRGLPVDSTHVSPTWFKTRGGELPRSSRIINHKENMSEAPNKFNYNDEEEHEPPNEFDYDEEEERDVQDNAEQTSTVESDRGMQNKTADAAPTPTCTTWPAKKKMKLVIDVPSSESDASKAKHESVRKRKKSNEKPAATTTETPVHATVGWRHDITTEAASKVQFRTASEKRIIPLRRGTGNETKMPMSTTTRRGITEELGLETLANTSGQNDEAVDGQNRTAPTTTTSTTTTTTTTNTTQNAA
jgi:hypothetical protein